MEACMNNGIHEDGSKFNFKHHQQNQTPLNIYTSQAHTHTLDSKREKKTNMHVINEEEEGSEATNKFWWTE